MPSAFGSYMISKGRTLLWSAHAEELVVRLDGSTPGTITGVWKRVQADGVQSPDGAGLVTYSGQALLVVKKSDLPDVTNLSRCEIDREGETWEIRHVESQDADTWQLHLSRRRKAMSNPKR